MSTYTDIVATLGDDGVGVQESRQSDFKALESIAYTDQTPERVAFCRGLATEWLVCKKQGTNFWESLKPTESTGLLGGAKLSDKARRVQDLYKALKLVDGVGWQACIDRLQEVGVAVNTGEDKKNNGKFGNWDWLISDHVLTKTSRFYYLSMRREGGAHTTAIYREYALIGKSSTTCFYDPNFGEFQLKNKNGLKTLIGKLSELGYEDRYSKNWHLQAYTG